MRYLIVGGAGFIGSHFVDVLLADHNNYVTIFDNFSSGRKWHYELHQNNPRFQVIQGDVKDLDVLVSAFQGVDKVIHLASNPDIARAATEPRVDFDEGTLLTFHVVEAARLSGVREILYASGSGVYGDIGNTEATENFGPLIPTSTYGASKLAGEALLSSYCHMFDLNATAFRFGNVVGPRQTHGVGFDFIRALRRDPTRLHILGDGKQSKSYIYVLDVVNAVLSMSATRKVPFEAFNIATGDYITVNEIAQIAISELRLSSDSVTFTFSGGDRGWKGDVPIVRLSTEKARLRGWQCSHSCEEALRISMRSMIADVDAGRL